MGLFDKLFQSELTEQKFNVKTEQIAWIEILYAVIAVDGINDAERDDFSKSVIFNAFLGKIDFIEAYKSSSFTHKEIGSYKMIENCAVLIDVERRPTLFATAVDLALSDGFISDNEVKIIEHLSKSLDLDMELAEKIIEVFLIRKKLNLKFTG